MRKFVFLLAALLVSGCVSQVAPTSNSQQSLPPNAGQPSERARQAVANFIEVVERVEPVAEQLCEEETPQLNCDFQILVDEDPRSGVNAFHTIDRSGRPLIIYTIGLIAVAENADELAFVMGHEAGHHIAQHLRQRQVQADAGAQVFSDLARSQGANAAGVGEAAQIGRIVASRQFTQRAELEADALGTAIAFRAGYDPLRGAQFFNRLPDPDGQFLSTHPPNAERLQTVRSALRAVRAGRSLIGS